MTYQPVGPLPDRSALQTRAITLIVLGFLCGGMLPAVFGIIALVQMDTDPYSAQRMNKVGWILLWVMVGLTVLFIVGYLLFVLLFVGAFSLPFLMGG